MSLRWGLVAKAFVVAGTLGWYVVAPVLRVAAANKPQAAARQDWPVYNGGINGNHYSPLTQIDKSNVHLLQQAWRFDAGSEGGLQTNPLIIGRTLYGYNAALQVVALDGATGKQIWKFDSGVTGGQPSRGFSYWTGPQAQKRLFAYIMNYVYCLDPETGRPIASFGEGGRLDMRKDLGNPFEENNVAMTTPGVVYKDLLIVGFRAPEVKPAPHGDIRAYNVLSGKLIWSFHTIPHPGDEGYETWPADAWKDAGAANNWAGMTVDEKRGIVFAPTGSAVSDFYGGDRAGSNLFANSLLALDASTGKKLWHFQDVHHDIWDRDFPSPPALVTVRHGGKMVDAVAQTSKQGYVFLFDRDTGKPLFPIEERPFPPSDVPGEAAAPTQPIPLAPEPYARQRLTADMLTPRPETHAWAVAEFKNLRSNGQFIPITLGKLTVVFPGFDGGAEWGGPAVDPKTSVMYVNSSEMAWLAGLVEAPHGGTPGAQLYQSQCAMCHGADRKGNPPAFPSLVSIESTMNKQQIAEVIRGGKGRMPSNPNLADPQVQSLLDYLHSPVDPAAAASPASSDSGGKDPEGAKVYAKNCAICHEPDRMGAPYFPSLIGIRARFKDEQTLALIHNGKGRMPAFSRISEPDMAALFRFLGEASQPLAAAADKKELGDGESIQSTHQARYNFIGYRKFLDPDGYPAIAPPWGTLNAIDLNTGKYLWKIPFGNYPELAAKGMTAIGTENYGGPVLTASGVLFIGATIYDRKMRAYDAQNGKLLWETDLPFAGNATPATYMIDGKQYLVIAASGMRDRKAPQGAAYVAFALP